MSKVQYTDAGLIITIPVADPAAEHAALMQSIVAIIRNSGQQPSNSQPILQLLSAMLPGEKELENGITPL